jgi:FlaG/FlaF family flagellin (archaellin)
MKHFNNTLDRNVNLSNIPEFEPDYSPRSSETEKIIVILLIALGVAGVFYTFNVGFKSSLSKATSQITRNVSSPVAAASFVAIPQHEYNSGKIIKETQVQIVGEKEANQSIQFTIDSYDEKAKYDLIMGDGNVLHPKNKTVDYTYENPGSYHIQLKVNYNGKSERIFSEDIQILESIVVAPSAHQEY